MKTLLLAGAVAATAVVPFAAPSSATPRTAVPHCTDSQLRIREGHGDGAAGHVGFAIRFKNHSGTTCSVRGYPGAAGLNKHGKQVVQATRTKRGMIGGLKPGHAIPTVVLKPGHVASAVIEGVDVPVQGHKCRTLHGLLVTAPNDFDAVHLHSAPPDCDGIQIHPVVKGKTGSQLR
jgi:hypothetical protein